jgi:serine/threonine-protein kinase
VLGRSAQRDGERDFVKIVDFGIAKISDLEAPGAPGRKLTKTGMIFGTPEYMSTEQAYGRPTDARSDIYGLGVIAYEMLTGRVPFEGETFMAVISQHMLDAPPPMAQTNPAVRIPAELEAIVRRTMEKEPEARFQSMAELHDALLAFMHRADLGAAVPSRLADVSFTAPLPRAPSELDSGVVSVVEARPTPRREELAPTGPGILRIEDESERPPSVRAGPPWGVLIGLFVVLIGSAAAVALIRPDALGLEGDDGATDLGGIPQVVPVNDSVGTFDARDAGAATMVEDGTVEVEIATTPAGATVRVDGAVVCGPTPCAIRLPVGAVVTVHAEHGSERGSREFTPTDVGGQLVIPLAASRPVDMARMTTMRSSATLPTDGTMASPDDLLRWNEAGRSGQRR